MWQYNHSELYHYGVPGMKWGVRKKTVVPSSDRAKADQIRKKKTAEMTNNELRDTTNRMILERQYKDAVRRTSKGRQAVERFVSFARTISDVTGALGTYIKFGKTIARGLNKSVKIGKFLRSATKKGVDLKGDGNLTKITNKQALKAVGALAKQEALKKPNAGNPNNGGGKKKKKK